MHIAWRPSFRWQPDGYFKQQGINLTIAKINGGEYGMGDLQTGKAQLIEGNYVSFVLAQIAGTFAAPNPSNPAQVLPAKPIDMRIIVNASQMQAGNQALYVLPSSPTRPSSSSCSITSTSASTRATTSVLCCSARCSRRTATR